VSVTHLDLVLSRSTFNDTGERYVEAASGSLVSTTKVGRFTFVGSLGKRSVFIYNRLQLPSPGAPAGTTLGQTHMISGMTYYGGVSYEPTRWLDISITAGQDVEANQVHNQAELMRFVRMDARLHLL
jgi:hypothetical protein